MKIQAQADPFLDTTPEDLAVNDLIERFRDMTLLLAAHGKDGLYLDADTLARAKRLAAYYADCATTILTSQMLHDLKTGASGQA